MANRIKELREEKGLSQEQLGALMNTTGVTVGRLENESRELTVSWLKRLSGALKVPAAEFLPLEYQTKRIKMAGKVQGGYWAEPGEEPEHIDEAPLDIPLPPEYRDFPLYALLVAGPSMNLVYPEGTILICCHMEYLREDLIVGKRYIVRRERPDGSAETTVKEYMEDAAGNHWLLPRSSDPAFFQPIPIEGLQGETVSAQARVLWAVSPQ